MNDSKYDNRALLESLVAGVIFGIIAFAYAFAILRNAQGEGWEKFPGCAGVAASLAGVAAWWTILARPSTHSIGRGLGAGALVGIISHPLAWYVFILTYYLSGTKDAMDPLQALWGAVVFSLFSWCVAWLTVPLAAGAGAAFALMMKWLVGKGSWDISRQ